MMRFRGFATDRNAVRLEHRSSNFDRKHLGTLQVVRAAFDRTPADQEPTDDSGPTSMRRGALALIGLGYPALFADVVLASGQLAWAQLLAGQPSLVCRSV